MKHWKKPAVWLIAILFAFSMGTLGNLSYASDETEETKEVLQTASESETTAEEEKTSATEITTEASTAETTESEQTSFTSEETEAETSQDHTKAAASSTAAPVSTQKLKKTAAEDTGILIDGSTVYAQGTPIVIKKDSDGKAYIFDASGTSRLSDTPVTSGFTIYGGGKNKITSGNVDIDIQNVQVSKVCGGGFSDGTGSADVSGNVSISITGSVNATMVYGGGYASASKGNASANVSGAVTVDIPSTPSSYHSGLHGGGYAYTTGSYNASADAGSVSISITGTTYSVQAGGSATSTGDGKASADVTGSVSCTLNSVDIREVYSGGSANGANAHAKCGSVTCSFTGSNNEVMIFHGAGDASNNGCADVQGNVTANLANCSNIYGYVTSAGTASGGGSADVYGSVSLNVVNSVSPVAEQWGNLVAAAFYGGGSASGKGSHADVKGSCSSLYKDSEIVGTIIGGGESSSGGSAKSAKVSLTLTNVAGNEYKGTIYYGDYILAGETDDAASADLAEAQKGTLTVTNSKTEYLWGGLLLKGESLASKTDSDLIIKDSGSSFDGIAHFDSLSISNPITLTSFEPKSSETPTILKITGLSVGSTAVTFQGSGASSNWLKLRNGKLAYKETDESASWSIASYETSSGSIAVEQPSGAPGITLGNIETDSLLTAEDKEKINTGSSIEIVLKSDPVSDPPENINKLLEKEMIRTNTQQAAVLDINLMKITDDIEEKIPTLDTPLRLTFDIPEEHQKDGRQFQVIRIHEESDGSYTAATLENLSTDPGKVTIETDCFSVYSLVYKDSQTPDTATTATTATASTDRNKNTSESKNTSENKNISKNKQTTIGKRSISKNTASKKGTSNSGSRSSGSVGNTAHTADTHRNLPSFLLLLSGSLICGGFLLKKRAE